MIYIVFIWLFSRNVKMLVFQAGAYEATKYLWVGRRLVYWEGRLSPRQPPGV